VVVVDKVSLLVMLVTGGGGGEGDAVVFVWTVVLEVSTVVVVVVVELVVFAATRAKKECEVWEGEEYNTSKMLNRRTTRVVAEEKMNVLFLFIFDDKGGKQVEECTKR